MYAIRSYYETLIGRLSRRLPEAVLEQLIYQPELTLELLQDEAKVTAWVNRLQQVLNEQGANGTHFDLTVRRNEERNLFLPQVRITSYNVCYTKLLRMAAMPEPAPG